MNTLLPLLRKVQSLLEQRFPACQRPRPAQRRRIEIQLEFPWPPKR
ncbi:MAG: hypothetical protein WEB53_15650 [Akkermansiaceae bacterium]